MALPVAHKLQKKNLKKFERVSYERCYIPVKKSVKACLFFRLAIRPADQLCRIRCKHLDVAQVGQRTLLQMQNKVHRCAI